MLSLSDNEFSVISFLVRNFSERLTIRNIAQRLKFSAAGVFNILKKLEKENIVVGEKLGTGLFYAINFENKIAQHLSSIVLLYSDGKFRQLDIQKFRDAKTAIFDNKTLWLISEHSANSESQIPGIAITFKTEDEFVSLLRGKDNSSLQILSNGVVLFGEEKIVEMIKKSIYRF